MDNGEKLFVFNLIGLFGMGHELEIEKDDSLGARNLNVAVVWGGRSARWEGFISTGGVECRKVNPM